MKVVVCVAALLGLSSAQVFVSQMLEAVNRARSAARVPPVCISPRLTFIAQRYASLQAHRGLGGHYVDGLTPTIRAGRYALSAENLFEGYEAAGSGNAQFATNELLRDAPHRHNILRPEFTHVGIGRRRSFRHGQPYYYWVQIFARSRAPCPWRWPGPLRPRRPTFPEMIVPPERRVTVKRTMQEPYPGAGVQAVEEVKRTVVDPTLPIDERGSESRPNYGYHPLIDDDHGYDYGYGYGYGHGY